MVHPVRAAPLPAPSLTSIKGKPLTSHSSTLDLASASLELLGRAPHQFTRIGGHLWGPQPPKGMPALHKSRDHPGAARADPRVHGTLTGKATAVSGRPSPWGTSRTRGHSCSPPPALLASTRSGHVWPGTFLPLVSLSFDSGPALFAGKRTRTGS